METKAQKIRDSRHGLDTKNKIHAEKSHVLRACAYTLGKMTHHERPTRRLVNALKKAMPDMVFSWQDYKSEFLDPMIHVWGGQIKYDDRLSIYLHRVDSGEPCNPIQYGADFANRQADEYEKASRDNDSANLDRLSEIWSSSLLT